VAESSSGEQKAGKAGKINKQKVDEEAPVQMVMKKVAKKKKTDKQHGRGASFK
jgi:hypothetical protein